MKDVFYPTPCPKCLRVFNCKCYIQKSDQSKNVDGVDVMLTAIGNLKREYLRTVGEL